MNSMNNDEQVKNKPVLCFVELNHNFNNFFHSILIIVISILLLLDFIYIYIIKQDICIYVYIYMLPIASQTAAPIGPIGTNCVDTHGWPGGVIG